MDDEPAELIDDRGPSGRHANSIKWPKGDPESSAREKFYRESKDKREIAKVQVLGLLRQGKSVTEAMPEVGRAMKTFYTWTRSDTKFRQRAQAAIDAHNLDQSKARMPYSEQMAEFEPILRKNYPTWTEYVVAFRKAYFNFDTFDHQWQILQAWEKAPAGGISVILIPPEWTKTTLLCDTMCADLCDNANTRRALISEASDQARKTMARIQRRFTYDGGVVPPLIDHFGPFQPLSTDRSRKWNSEEFTLLASDHDEQDPSVISVGIQGAIRGARWDAIDLDDVQSVRNLGATAKIMRIFRADVITRPGKQGRIRVTGTRVGREDFYGELERLDLIDEYVTIPALNLSRPKGQQSNFPPQFTPAGAPICADNGEQLGWTDDQLAQRRQKVGEDEWQRVYMQAPQSEHAAMVNDGDILSATDRTRVVGEYVAASVGTIVGLDPALQGHAAFTVCGYNADFMYVTDLVDLFRPTTNQRVFTEIGRLSAKYRPEFWVIENNNIQSGYLVDDAFLAMQEQYGFQAVSHHTGVDKTDRDSQLAVPAMMNAIVRGEIRFPTISENDTAFATLFDQLKSWRPDIPTRRLLQDQVVSLWFCYRLWRNLRETVNQTADSWKRSGLESVTMYPWAQSNIQGPNEQVHERMSMTYAQNWERLNVSKSA